MTHSDIKLELPDEFLLDAAERIEQQTPEQEAQRVNPWPVADKLVIDRAAERKAFADLMAVLGSADDGDPVVVDVISLDEFDAGPANPDNGEATP
jgi:hypothetical protein